MKFFAPSALAFLALIPPIVLMYFLKIKRQELVISSTYLWDQILRDLQANTPWQRLKQNLLLILQVLAVAVLAVVLARPYLPVTSRVAGTVVVLIDPSPSMLAVDVKPDRLGRAKDEARKLVDRLGPRDEMTVIATGKVPKVVQAGSRDKVSLRRAIARIKAEAGAADLEQALSLARSVVKGRRGAQVVVITDGKTLPVEQGFAVPFQLEYIKIGGKPQNVALLSMATRPSGKNQMGLTRVVNYGTTAVEAGLELLADGRLIDVRNVTLAPGEEKSVLWADIPGQVGVVQARLTEQDDFSLDNQVWTVTNQTPNQRILLVSPGNVFLERVLTLRKGLRLYRVSPGSYRLVGGYDLYVYDGFMPGQLPKGNIMVFNPPANNPLVGVGEEYAPGGLESAPGMARNERLLQFVNLGDVHIARARQLVPDIDGFGATSSMEPAQGGSGSGTVGSSSTGSGGSAAGTGSNKAGAGEVASGAALITSAGKPILVTGELGSRRYAAFGFDIHQSDLPLRPAFPILMQNLLDYLLPPASEQVETDGVGESVHINALPLAEKVSVTTPSGKSIELGPPFPLRTLVETGEIGVYTVEQEVRGQTVVGRFALNLGSELESDLSPAPVLPLSHKIVRPQAAARVSNQELWPVGAWIALILLAAEWWVYYRGY